MLSFYVSMKLLKRFYKQNCFIFYYKCNKCNVTTIVFEMTHLNDDILNIKSAIQLVFKICISFRNGYLGCGEWLKHWTSLH